MAQRLIPALQQVIDSSNVTIGVGYKLYTYETGTTTPKATYSDENLTTAQTNPLEVNSDGYFASSTDSSQTNVWVSDKSLYKIVLTDADDNTIATYDPVDAQSNSLVDFDPMPTVYLGTTGGTGSAYTLTSDVGLTQYLSTQSFLITFHATNTSSPTIDIDGLGTLGLYYYADDGTETELPAGTINIGQTYLLNSNSDGTGLIITVLQSQTITASTSTQGLAYLSSFITITNNSSDSSHDIDFSAGVFNFSDGSGQSTFSALTKQIDVSWSSGTNAGGLFTGTVAASTWYHCFVIYNPTTGATDAGFDTSVVAANIPSGYTKYSYRGSILTNSSSTIYAFAQLGNYFEWAYPFNEYNAASPTTLTLLTTTVPPNISVIGCYSISNLSITNQTAYMRLSYPTATDATPTALNSQFQCQGSGGFPTLSSTYVQVKTNTSKQIGFRSSNSNVSAVINTFGYIIPSNILY